MDKLTIAARAGKGFKKSYVKNIVLAKVRNIPNHVAGGNEQDYFFTYKGKEYRVNEHIVPNKKGEVIYSAKYRYDVQEIL